tara:strand:+ start:191 stop:703 length:513 start_codon:yes stop_codon:yes gene_type:complete
MDHRLRELQRQIAAGDPSAVQQLDTHLSRSGWDLVGLTSEYGASPDEAVWLDPITEDFYALVIRRADGNLDYRLEEAGQIGEHIGEYSHGEAHQLGQHYLTSVSPAWAADNTVCANPLCASKGRTVILTDEDERIPGLSAREIRQELRCVECGHRWTTHQSRLDFQPFDY